MEKELEKKKEKGESDWERDFVSSSKVCGKATTAKARECTWMGWREQTTRTKEEEEEQVEGREEE